MKKKVLLPGLKPRNLVDAIRRQRDIVCFPVINRGKLWYDSLSYEQLGELKQWYQEWLDAPSTLCTPGTPSWINKKLEPDEEVL